MGDMLIRGIPDPLKSELEEAAKRKGESLSSRAIDLMRKGLLFERGTTLKPGKPAGGALRAFFEQQGAIDDDFAALLDEIEAEEKTDLGRRVDFPGAGDTR